MRLRTFTAPDMPAALKMVRDALGDNAIILSSDARGKGGLTITAAVDERDEPVPAPKQSHHAAPKFDPPPRDDPAADHLRFELQNILRFHNLPELFVAKMMQRASDNELSSILALNRTSANRSQSSLLRLAIEKLTGAYFDFAPLDLQGNHKIMLVGQPGIGKTLSIAKIAARLAMDKQPLSIVTTDTRRAGGVEQLQAFTNILGVPLHVADSPEALQNLIKTTGARSRMLIDTAGCNPYSTAELDELKMLATLEGIEPVLVMQSGGDSLEAVDMAEIFTILPIKRLMVTRADTARRFGGVMAAAAAHGLAFSHASSSSSIIDKLQPMDTALMAQLLLRYQAYQLQTQ